MEILIGIISKIFEYTVEPVGRQVGYLINYKSNLQNMRSQLDNLNDAKDRIKHRVDEAERNCKGVEADVQNWRKEADGITQEVEKILGNKGQAKTKCFCGVCPNLVSYHQLSRESSKLAKKIEFHKQVEFPRVSYDVVVEDRAAIPPQEDMPFESRTSLVNKIMAELRNPDTNMIGVYGLGGVGKTTLAKEVFRQANNKEDKLFDDVVIILNVKEKQGPEIQKEIAERLGMDVKEYQSMEARANCLCHRIKDKKTLVILDDVLGRIDLEAVGVPCVPTCNLLLTSRERNVLFSEMRTRKDFPLDLLCQQDSWSLFKKMAGDFVENDHVREVATAIAKKCGGLPILVVTVASALRLSSTLEEWKDALRRFERFDDKELTEKPFLGIEWSYNRLDAEQLQPLFLLCGIMAQSNYNILLSDLLKYTIGLGLVKKVSTVEEVRNALHASVRKLKHSSLLLDGYDDETVRMHDVVRDVAVQIASRDQHVLSRAYTEELDESPSKECSLISLRHCTISKLPEEPWECPKLTMFLLEASDDSLEIPSNFFEGMKELRVLDLTRLHFLSLPLSRTVLTNLETLCLGQCVLGDIALVGQLTNLKVLSLKHSKVKELPEQIGQLTRLQLLDLSYCSELVRIPHGVISSLTRLEDLRIKSFKQWEGEDGRSNASIIELKHLSKLTVLEIHIPDANILPTNFFSDKLERYIIFIGLQQLCILHVENCGILEEIVAKEGVVETTTDLEFVFPKVTSLTLENLPQLRSFYPGLHVSKWPLLKELTFDKCGKVEIFAYEYSRWQERLDSCTTIKQPFLLVDKVMLPNLTALFIDQRDGLRFLFSFSMATSLVQLTHLQISSCQILEEIVTEIGSSEENTEKVGFPSLESLMIYDMPKLMTIFPASVTKGLQQLRELNVRNCGILEEIVAKEGVETTAELEFVFPKVTSLTFYRLPQLRSLYPGLHVSKWPLLKQLNFHECGKVEILASEYSRWQERLVKQPFLLIDKGNPFPNLEELGLDGHTEISYEAHGPLPAEWFKNLKRIRFYRAHPNSFAFVEKLHVLEELVVEGDPWKEIFVYEGTSSGEIDAVRTTLPHIKNLCLEQMEELMHLGNDNSESIFPNLKILTVKYCGRLKNLTSSAISFRNLTTLNVWSCNGLKYLVTYSVAKCLHQLKILEVWSCKSIIEIVASNIDGQDSENYYEIAFNCLQRLELWGLPSLRGFCSSGNCTVRVPSLRLNYVIVTSCPIELKIDPNGPLIHSGSRPERQQITEDVEEKEEEDGNETGGKQLIAHTN